MNADLDELETAIGSLEKGDHTGYQDLVQKIHLCAKDHGLMPEHLSRVIILCTTEKINVTRARVLVDSLMPAEHVPEDAVVCVLARICSGTVNITKRKLLLKWTTKYYHCIQPKSNIYSMYGMLFNIVDHHDVLLAPTCNLLSLMTRKQDATVFRLLQLARCREKFGVSQPLRRLANILKANAPRSINGSLHSVSEKELEECKTALPAIDIPANYASVFNETCNLNNPKVSYSLSQRCHILTISNMLDVEPQLQIWLNQQLYAMMVENSKLSSDAYGMFNVLFKHKGLLHNTCDIWGSFLYEFLGTWNGRDHRDLILNFVANVPLTHFLNLQDRIFYVFGKILTSSDDLSLQHTIIETLSDLTCRYIVAASDAKKSDQYIVSEDCYPESIVTKLIKETENMLLQSMALGENESSQLYATLNYWEMVSNTLLSTESDIIVVPRIYFIYKALFGINNAHVSSICQILYRLLQVFENNGVQNTGISLADCVSEVYEVLWKHESINLLRNKYLITVEDTDTEEKHTTKCSAENSKPCFSLHKHPALIAFVAKFTMDAQHKMPAFSLKEKNLMLSLEIEGMSGIVNFLKQLDCLAKKQHGEVIE